MFGQMDPYSVKCSFYKVQKVFAGAPAWMGERVFVHRRSVLNVGRCVQIS